MSIIRKSLLNFHTIKYLKLIQIIDRIKFLFKNSIIKYLIISLVEKKKNKKNPDYFPLVYKNSYPHIYTKISTNYEFNFLNAKVIYGNTIIWNNNKQEKLWLYNLHYFDYILQEFNDETKNSTNFKKQIILSWIDNNPIGKGVGWEPYPLSLRIVNWIFFYNIYSKQIENDIQFESVFLENLFKQCAYLTHFIEYHLLANHLFKNAKALFIAGLFYSNTKWQKLGTKILELELKEQILPDGGHFERSPMYHSITLEDILDLVNFYKNSNSIFQNFFRITELEDIAEKMLLWLGKVCHPDGEIPLIGDSAFKIAPDFKTLKEYYLRVTGKNINSSILNKSTSLSDSGYYVFRSDDQYMIVDAGNLGVRYQPGHAHCDLLSFEYSYKKTRIFVDSGVGNYLKSDLRHNARSIKAHNTVMINNLEQGEIWAAFRMGRRISINPNELKFYSENNMQNLSASYENNLNSNFKYVHKRDIEFFENKFFLINDYINSKNIKSINSFFHLAPDASMSQDNNKIEININNNIINLYIKHYDKINMNDWFYTPEFGKMQNSKVIVIEPSIEKLTNLTYIICPKVYVSHAESYIQNNWK